MVVGIILALLAAIFWGSINVPILKLKESSLIINTFSTTAAFLIAFAVYFVTLPVITVETFIYGLISGILWSIASTLVLMSMKKIGIGKVAAITASTQIIIASVFGILIFNEIINKGLTNLFVASLGILFVIIGIYTVSSINEKKNDKFNKTGLILAFISGIVFSFHILPIRFAQADPLAIILPMTFGMCSTAWILVILIEKEVKTTLLAIKRSMFSGSIWLIGNYLDFFAISMIGLAKGFSLGQLLVLVSTLWSVFYFREFMKKRNILLLMISAVIIILGAVLLAFAKT
jgi:glucose uptake protein